MLDPNWVAAIGQWAGAAGTFAAVVVALYLAQKSGRQGLQDRYNAARPLISIDGDDAALPRSPGNPPWLAWDAKSIELSMHNVGNGPAFNIASVIYGAESYVVGNLGSLTRVSGEKNSHWTCWDAGYLAVGVKEAHTYVLGASTFYKGRNRIRDHTFYAPPQPFFSAQAQEPTYVCRVVTTYHDIFGHKHASIFQYRLMPPSWECIVFEEAITEDLHDLEGHKKGANP